MFSCLFCLCSYCLYGREPRLLEHTLSCRLRQSSRAKILLGCSQSRGAPGGLKHHKDLCSSALSLPASCFARGSPDQPRRWAALPLLNSLLLLREEKMHLLCVAHLSGCFISRRVCPLFTILKLSPQDWGRLVENMAGLHRKEV